MVGEPSGDRRGPEVWGTDSALHVQKQKSFRGHFYKHKASPVATLPRTGDPPSVPPDESNPILTPVGTAHPSGTPGGLPRHSAYGYSWEGRKVPINSPSSTRWVPKTYQGPSPLVLWHHPAKATTRVRRLPWRLSLPGLASAMAHTRQGKSDLALCHQRSQMWDNASGLPEVGEDGRKRYSPLYRKSRQT